MKVFLTAILLVCQVLTACSNPVTGGNDGPGETIYPVGDQTYTPANVRRVLDRQQKAAFSFFYEGAEPISGMALEGNNRGNTVTIGGSGFGVMALIVGIERGWITREQGIERIQKIISWLGHAERYKGVWSHWYNPDGTYVAFGDQKATGDLVETGFLVEGLLAVREYFDKDTQAEKDIRDGIDALYDGIDWAGYTGTLGDGLYWLWYSIEDRYSLKISGWNEALASYICALGAKDDKCISREIYDMGWNVPSYPNRKVNGYSLPLGNNEKGGPLFFSHYSFVGFDPRYMQDDKAWYWQQNQSHTMINRHYCIYDAPSSHGYNVGLWGLTACYGAGSSSNYSARNPKGDDGVIAPTAALSSYPYTPFYSTQVLMTLDKIEQCQGVYGFADSYKPSEQVATKNHLAIDQGPIVVMIENYRSGLLWKLVMKNEFARKGLSRAGIHEPVLNEGFPYVVPDTKTGIYDLIAHPDKEKYEIEYYVSNAGVTHFQVVAGSSMDVIQEYDINSVAGVNVFSFDDTKVTRGKKYYICMTTSAGKTYQIESILH